VTATRKKSTSKAPSKKKVQVTTTGKKSASKSPSKNLLTETHNWIDEPDVFCFRVDLDKLTNAFGKLASKPSSDSNTCQTIEDTCSVVQKKYGLSREQALKTVLGNHAQAAVEITKLRLFRFLAEDAADLLSLFLDVAVDNTAKACGLPRVAGTESRNALLGWRADRIRTLFQTGRLKGQTGSRHLSLREKKNRANRLRKTLEALDALSDGDHENLTRVAKKIGISPKQFRKAWVPDILEQTRCESWELFIAPATRANVSRRLEGKTKSKTEINKPHKPF
jgi:hypothetical protein